MATKPGRRLAAFAYGIAVFCMVCLATQLTTAQEPPNGAYSAAMKKGKLLSEQRKYKASIETYHKANDLAGGESMECLLSLAILHNRTKDSREAEDFARRVIARAERPEILRLAYRELGVALQGKPGPWASGVKSKRLLKEAEQAFRKVVDFGAGDGTIYFLLANVLTDRMIRAKEWDLHEEIKTLAGKYLSMNPNEHYSDWARDVRCGIDEILGDEALRLNQAQTQEASHTEAAPGADWPLHVGGEVIKPEKVFAPGPTYSSIARKARIEGVVILQAIIDKQGNVTNIRILKGLPLCLSEDAIKTVKSWKFTPAMLDGRPVDVYYNLTVNFRLG